MTFRTCSNCYGFQRGDTGERVCIAGVLIRDATGVDRKPGPGDYCPAHATPAEDICDVSLMAEAYESLGSPGVDIAARAITAGRAEVGRFRIQRQK